MDFIKRLSLTQKITLLFTIVAFIVSRLEVFGVSVQTIAVITEIVGILKFVYDTIMSYSDAEVKDFARYVENKPISKSLSGADDIDAYFEDWKNDNVG